MFNLSINLIVSLLLFISIIGIGIYIQVKLSGSENKFLGLIMPIISFLLSVLGMTMLTIFTPTSQVGYSSIYLSVVFLFLITNIPTFVLGGIYLSERNKFDVKKYIEKMKIDDL